MTETLAVLTFIGSVGVAILLKNYEGSTALAWFSIYLLCRNK